MPQFDVSSYSSQIFWLSIVFSTIYLVTKYFLAPRLESLFEERNSILSKDLQVAEDFTVQANVLDVTCQERLIEINSRVEDMQREALDIFANHCKEKTTTLVAQLEKKQRDASNILESDIRKFYEEESVSSYFGLSRFIIERITNRSVDINALKIIINKVSKS